jgi:3-phenylpropionate/trans-cinnamate dioxygenase ferredoxin reductase subunit
MLEKGAPYDYVHSFWSDQYDESLEYLGFARDWDRLALRGTLESRRFLAFYLKGDVVQAVFGLNRGGDPEDPEQDGELKACLPLIRDRIRVDPARLADQRHDLAGLAVS